jgi:hypothetical protein
LEEADKLKLSVLKHVTSTAIRPRRPPRCRQFKYKTKTDGIGSHYGLRHNQHAGKTMRTCLLIEGKKKNAAKPHYSIAKPECL